MRYLIYKNKKGFSLIEVILAVFVITIGITGAVNLATYSISNVAVGKSQIIATNLSQEGLEIIRNIRDSNWLKDIDWNDGLKTDGDYRVQYNSLDLLDISDSPALNIDNTNPDYVVYLYDDGKPKSRFSRKISIANINSYEIKVVSEVTWKERGHDYEVNAETRLYDWK